jgi:hypothetical protein
MSGVGSLKAIEVLLLLAAGAGFVWWQLRDVSRAQQRSRAEREEREQREQRQAGSGQDAEPAAAEPPP